MIPVLWLWAWGLSWHLIAPSCQPLSLAGREGWRCCRTRLGHVTQKAAVGFEHWTARRFPLCSNTTVHSLVNRKSQVGKSTSIDPSHFGGGPVLSPRPWGLVCPGHLLCFLQGWSWVAIGFTVAPGTGQKQKERRPLSPGDSLGGISGLSWNIISKERFTEKESYYSIRKRTLKCTLPWTAAPCRHPAGPPRTPAQPARRPTRPPAGPTSTQAWHTLFGLSAPPHL